MSMMDVFHAVSMMVADPHASQNPALGFERLWTLMLILVVRRPDTCRLDPRWSDSLV